MSFYQKQWQFLVKSIWFDKVGHAYLFSGPSDFGKRETALNFAKLLNCQNGEKHDIYCGICPSCIEMAKGCHPDFLMVENIPEKDSGKDEKQINLIRDINQWLGLKPLSAKYKVVIIDQLQNFSLPAQSAFLKTLEEPRGNAVIVIISDYQETLLPTILSRVEEIKFPVSVEMPTGKEDLRMFAMDLKKDISFWFRQIERICKNDEGPLSQLRLWLSFLRSLFLAEISGAKTGSLPAPKLRALLSSLDRAHYLISKTNANPKLTLENAFLKLL